MDKYPPRGASPKRGSDHHLRDRHGSSWDRFSVYLTIGDSHLKELESLILRIVRPGGNKQKGHFAKSADIRRRFARDVRQRHQAELDQMLGKTRTGRARHLNAASEDSRTAPLQGFGIGPTALRGLNKGTLFKARVRRDGMIRFGGKLYRSPSHAATAALKRACNGWWFWTYERAPGDWVRLNTLRK